MSEIVIEAMIESVRGLVEDASIEEVVAAAALAYCQDAKNVGHLDAHGARLARLVKWMRVNGVGVPR